jgi:O-acetyl-ADP-ribose deacetylase (regulator of RNase III)
MTVIEVVQGDITLQNTDAIVTAANESLMGGGGVDGAIHRAAGPRLADAGVAIGPCDPGDAMSTPAFDLDPPVKHVIHTVGPVWEGGAYGEAAVLASCYRRCLEVADELGAKSVAIPAIATGVYGFPAEEAAQIAVATLRSSSTGVEQIRLVAFDQQAHDLLVAALNSLGSPERALSPFLVETSSGLGEDALANESAQAASGGVHGGLVGG